MADGKESSHHSALLPKHPNTPSEIHCTKQSGEEGICKEAAGMEGFEIMGENGANPTQHLHFIETVSCGQRGALCLPWAGWTQFSPGPARPSLFLPGAYDALHSPWNWLQEQFVFY